jgi:hypothetical protein
VAGARPGMTGHAAVVPTNGDVKSTALRVCVCVFLCVCVCGFVCVFVVGSVAQRGPYRQGLLDWRCAGGKLLSRGHRRSYLKSQRADVK